MFKKAGQKNCETKHTKDATLPVVSVSTRSLETSTSPLAVLSARGIGHLAEMLHKDGFVSIEDLSHLQQLPDLTKDLVLREWKDSRKMALKDWAKLHALIYSGSF